MWSGPMSTTRDRTPFPIKFSCHPLDPPWLQGSLQFDCSCCLELIVVITKVVLQQIHSQISQMSSWTSNMNCKFLVYPESLMYEVDIGIYESKSDMPYKSLVPTWPILIK